MTVFQIIIHTPIWVWPLYAGLLFLGFQSTHDRTLPLLRMLILPLVLALLAISSFIGNGMSALPAMLLGLVIGGTLGWRLERDGATRRLPNGALWLRGEWGPFAQIVLILVFRYASSIVSAINPVLNADPSWHSSTLFISTALSALFLGRTAARLRVYFAAAPATV